MKSFFVMLAMVVACCISQQVQAETFPPKGPIKAWAEPSGLVHWEGSAEVLEDYVRNRVFCPDRFRASCGNNFWVKIERVSPTHVTAQMDMDAVKNLNMRGFNPRNAAKQWSQIPNADLTVGPGLVLERSYTPADDPGQSPEDGKAGGCFYTFIADLPNYVPSGAGSCDGGSMRPVVMPARPVVSAAPASSTGERNNDSAVANVIKSPSGMANAANNAAAAANNTKAGVVEVHANGAKGPVTVKTKIRQQTATNAQGGISIKGGIRNAKGGTLSVNLTNSPVNITVQQMGSGKYACTDCSNPAMWGVFEKFLLTVPKNQEGPTKEAAKNLTYQTQTGNSDTSSKK